MGALGDVLEAIYDSRRRIRSYRASGRGWRAGQRWAIWWAGPDRIRAEERRGDETLVTVRLGPTWWIKRWDGGVDTNAGDEDYHVGLGPGTEVLNGRSLLAAASLELLGEGRVADRPVARLRASPRHDEPVGTPGWHFEEPIDLAVDIERGAVLETPAVSVEEIVYDERFPDDLFAPLVPDGGGRAALAGRQPLTVTLDEARRLVSFPISLPGLLPEGARLAECTIDSIDPPAWANVTWLVEPGNRYSVNVTQGPGVAAHPPDPNADIVSRSGLELRVRSWAGEIFRQTQVRIERGDRAAEVHSDLPTEMVLDIAASWPPHE